MPPGRNALRFRAAPLNRSGRRSPARWFGYPYDGRSGRLCQARLANYMSLWGLQNLLDKHARCVSEWERIPTWFQPSQGGSDPSSPEPLTLSSMPTTPTSGSKTTRRGLFATLAAAFGVSRLPLPAVTRAVHAPFDPVLYSTAIHVDAGPALTATSGLLVPSQDSPLVGLLRKYGIGPGQALQCVTDLEGNEHYSVVPADANPFYDWERGPIFPPREVAP